MNIDLLPNLLEWDCMIKIRNYLVIILMICQMLFAFTGSAHYPYENEVEPITFNLGSNLDPEDHIEKNLVFDRKSKSFNITKIVDSFVYDPVIVYFQIYQTTSEFEKLELFDLRNLKIQLRASFLYNSSLGYQEFGNQTFNVIQHKSNNRELSVSFDPSQDFYDITSWYNTTDQIDKLRDSGSGNIDISLQVIITQSGWTRLKTRYFFIESDIATSTSYYLGPDDLHHQISGHLVPHPRNFEMNNSNWTKHWKIYVPISLSLTTTIFKNLLKSHNYTSTPTLGLFIRLRIVENQFPIEQEPPDIRLFYKSRKFVSSQSFDDIDFHLEFTPQNEQIIELDLYNYGFSTYFFIDSIKIEIPAFFVEPLPSNWDIFWESVKNNAFNLFIIFGLLLGFMQSMDFKNGGNYEAPIKPSKKKKSNGRYTHLPQKSTISRGDAVSIIDPGGPKKVGIGAKHEISEHHSTTKTTPTIEDTGNWIVNSNGYLVDLDKFEKIDLLDYRVEKSINRFLDGSEGGKWRNNIFDPETISEEPLDIEVNEKENNDLQKLNDLDKKNEVDSLKNEGFKSIFPYYRTYFQERETREDLEADSQTDHEDTTKFSDSPENLYNHITSEPDTELPSLHSDPQNSNKEDIHPPEPNSINPSETIEEGFKDEINKSTESQYPEQNELNEDLIERSWQSQEQEHFENEVIVPRSDHIDNKQLAIDEFVEDQQETKVPEHHNKSDPLETEDEEFDYDYEWEINRRRKGGLSSSRSPAKPYDSIEHVDHEKKNEKFEFARTDVEEIFHSKEIEENYQEGINQIKNKDSEILPADKRIEQENIPVIETNFENTDPTKPSYNVSEDEISEILEYLAEGKKADEIYWLTGIDMNFITMVLQKMDILQSMIETGREAEYWKYHHESGIEKLMEKNRYENETMVEESQIDEIKEDGEFEFDPTEHLKELLEPITVITFTREILDLEIPLSAPQFKKVTPKPEDVEKYKRSPYIEVNTLKGVKGLVKLQDAARMHFLSLVYAARKSLEVMDQIDLLGEKSNKVKVWHIFAHMDFATTYQCIQEPVLENKMKVYEYLGINTLGIEESADLKMKAIFYGILRFWNPQNNVHINSKVVSDWIINNEFNKILREKIFFRKHEDARNKEAFHVAYNQILSRVMSNYYLYSEANQLIIDEKIFEFPYFLKYHPQLINNFYETLDSGTGTDAVYSILKSKDIEDLIRKIPYLTYRMELKNLIKLDKEDFREGGKPITIHKFYSKTLANDLLLIGLPGKKTYYDSILQSKDLNKLLGSTFRSLDPVTMKRFVALNNLHRSGKNKKIPSEKLTFMKTKDIGAHYFDRLSRNSQNVGLNSIYKIKEGMFGYEDLSKTSKNKKHVLYRTGFNYKEIPNTIKWEVSLNSSVLPKNERISIDLLNAISIKDKFIGELYAYMQNGKWKVNKNIDGIDLERIQSHSLYLIHLREYMIAKNQLNELANTGMLIKLADSLSLTLGSDLPTRYSLTKATKMHKIILYTGTSSLKSLQFSLIIPNNDGISEENIKSFKANISACVFHAPRNLYEEELKYDSLGSFRLGVLPQDINEWGNLTRNEKKSILNTYSIDLWKSDVYFKGVNKSVHSLKNQKINLNQLLNYQKPSWIYIIEESKVKEKSELSAFKNSKQKELWEKLNNETPDLINIMIKDLLKRIDGRTSNMGILQAYSRAWGSSKDHLKVSQHKGIAEMFSIAGKASSNILSNNAKNQINPLNDTRNIRGYDVVLVDEIFASKMTNQLYESKMRDIKSYRLAKSLYQFAIMVLYNPYYSLYAFPNPKKNMVRFDYQSLATPRYKASLIKTLKNKLHKKIKIYFKDQNLLSRLEYLELTSELTTIFKPTKQYHGIFPTHQDYKNQTKGGNDLSIDHLSLGRIFVNDNSGLSLSTNKDRIIIEVTNPRLLAISLRDYIYVGFNQKNRSMKDKNYLPAYISDPILWERWLDKLNLPGSYTTPGQITLRPYDQKKDPPLKFSKELIDINSRDLNIEQLLLGKENGKHYNILYLENEGIDWKLFKTGNLTSSRGSWLFYLVSIENALRLAQPFENIDDARQDKEFLKIVKVVEKTLFAKAGQGKNSKTMKLSRLTSLLSKSNISPKFTNMDLNSEDKYRSIAEFLAYHFNIEALLITRRLLPKINVTGKVEYYYFKDKSQYEKTFLGMDWSHYPLPYRMPHEDSLKLRRVRNVLFQMKNHWVDGEWEKVLLEYKNHANSGNEK